MSPCWPETSNSSRASASFFMASVTKFTRYRVQFELSPPSLALQMSSEIRHHGVSWVVPYSRDASCALSLSLVITCSRTVWTISALSSSSNVKQDLSCCHRVSSSVSAWYTLLLFSRSLSRAVWSRSALPKHSLLAYRSLGSLTSASVRSIFKCAVILTKTIITISRCSSNVKPRRLVDKFWTCVVDLHATMLSSSNRFKIDPDPRACIVLEYNQLLASLLSRRYWISSIVPSPPPGCNWGNVRTRH